MTAGELRTLLDHLAPEADQLDWDNSGFLVGETEREILTVYLALDATTGVIRHAAHAGADMIITHHPLIFHGIQRVTDEDYVGRRVLLLAQHGIALYAMHTDFDIHGMRDAIDPRLGLKNPALLDPEDRIGSVADLEAETTLGEYAALVRHAFGLSAVKVFGDDSMPVHRVAVCGGSGKSEIQNAVRAGADVYVTGDIDHHSGLDALEQGLAVIDAGHWGLEHVFIDYIEAYLHTSAPALTVFKEPPEEPFHILTEEMEGLL